MPGVGGNLYNHAAALRNNLVLQSPEAAQQQPNQFYRPGQSYNGFTPSNTMPPPVLHDNSNITGSFPQQSPVSASFDTSARQSMRHPSMNQVPPDSTTSIPQTWNGALFDPSDPALFNFDLASMNFGNHYGALEFGMLGHMATGADATPPSDSTTHRGSIGHPNGSSQYPIPMGSFSESPNASRAFSYSDPMSDWTNGPNLYGQQFPNGPHAFAIETNNPTFTSPESGSSPPGVLKFEDSPTISTSTFRQGIAPSAPLNNIPAIVNKQQNQLRQPHISTPQLKGKSQLPTKSSKRPRDPSSIYTTVTSPYSYTTGFHSLIAYLQRRFAASPSKTLAIAKSLASIRPSFIATTKTLNRDDLIFMEKCFQRTLWEYEGFIEGVGTPTIVARRTGEVAAVGKEFSILTGWTKDVLLGRVPNMNVNRGGTGSNSAAGGSGANTTGRATGVNTPNRVVANEGDEKRLQPVFLAELLDDDSVVEFYEGFARLAFGDSRGSVMGKGKLLKYKTKEDQVAQGLKREAEAAREADSTTNSPEMSKGTDSAGARRHSSGVAKRQSELKKEGIAGERGMQKLGLQDGKVECTYCWTVKRDVFDIPMLIVMNVSTDNPPVSRTNILPVLALYLRFLAYEWVYSLWRCTATKAVKGSTHHTSGWNTQSGGGSTRGTGRTQERAQWLRLHGHDWNGPLHIFWCWLPTWEAICIWWTHCTAVLALSHVTAIAH